MTSLNRPIVSSSGRARLDDCHVSMLSGEPYVEGARETARVDPATFVNKNVDFRYV